jgi:hypothetical protein
MMMEAVCSNETFVSTYQNAVQHGSECPSSGSRFPKVNIRVFWPLGMTCGLSISGEYGRLMGPLERALASHFIRIVTCRPISRQRSKYTQATIDHV